VESEVSYSKDAPFREDGFAQKSGFPTFPQAAVELWRNSRESLMTSKKTGKTTATRQATRLDLQREMEAVADERKARNLAWFFKTGPGEYGEGDQFLGLTVPVSRKIGLRYIHLPLTDISKLLASPIHEHRFVALEILVAQYERADETRRQEIFDFYLQNTHRANNWDLVDTSCRYIVGEHLVARSNLLRQALLDQLASSPMLWERRIAIVSTFAFLANGETKETFRIARKLLYDKEPLIHKAVGWLLREAGKVSRPELVRFLEKHAARMPRTTLRYAIERFPPAERKQWLQAGRAEKTG
jgi:3-methyladenine DNA glycosylase AlkD